jgi:hypothetical protein
VSRKLLVTGVLVLIAFFIPLGRASADHGGGGHGGWRGGWGNGGWGHGSWGWGRWGWGWGGYGYPVGYGYYAPYSYGYSVPAVSYDYVAPPPRPVYRHHVVHRHVAYTTHPQRCCTCN